ncbi:BTAD domain-containing putative transcriptional regulator [Microbispora siamensis]|uniref:ATPase AAA n=1 Tax=Microbispora siamensis TaxID=564413 RepID=A0ABQ4GES0_9ACTN|nr:BTAD domain-containing putative transcriptional regulator [Microbispora siamensis]GIH59894.1 ATPase AAA [Microbispora siamensis]
MIRIRVLGALEAEVDGAPAQLGGPRQRGVLALLVAARGEVVSADRLIDDLWRGEPPAKALASLQTYVANLRRALEPGRPRRTPARVLVSAAPGYALRLDGHDVDAWRFERLVAEAREAAGNDPALARALLDEALGLWRGAAFAEVADEEWAAPETARLEELRQSARELLVATTLRSSHPADAVPMAEVLTRRQPLREEGWRLLALALWGSGRQADALAALRRARATLSEELGLDPGPGLSELEQAILTQRTDPLDAALRPVSPPRPAPPHPAPPRPAPAVPLPARPAEHRTAEHRTAGPERTELFVGRRAELDALKTAAAEVLSGHPRIAIVSGEAGAGKSALLGRLLDGLSPEHWLVTVGRCPEDEGAPPAWAWVEALRPLAAVAPPGGHAPALSPLLGDGQVAEDAAAGRFRMHRAVAAWLREVCGHGRALAVVLDDLHRADGETVALLSSLAEELMGGGARVLLVVALRPSEVTDAHEDALAALARRRPVRVQLGGLSPAEVETLVTAVCERPVDRATAVALSDRTGGNPFYVWESARLLASEGTLSGDVPEGVRDVLRRRLARLPATAVGALRLAAVVGREAEVEVLVRAAGTGEDVVLDGLEAGVISGLLTEPAPGRVRFVHALVRDTLYQDLPGIRLARMHARVADALRALHPDDLTALAHHYARAATSATALAAVDYSVRAAELATRRYAHDAAVGLLAQALECFERVPDAADRDARRVELLGLLLRARVRAGDVVGARATRRQAVDVAEQAGREDLLVAAFTSWTEATPWHIRPYGTVDGRTVELLTRLLRRTDLKPVTRCLLLTALVGELEGENDPRAAAAAREAEELAERAGDVGLRAMAIVLRSKDMSFERAPHERAELARRLGALADEHDLVAYRWYAEYTLATAAGATGDVAALRRHHGRALEIARTYRMAEAESVGMCGVAMLAHIEGRLGEAERLYGLIHEKMRREGSMHADGLHAMAMTTVRISQGRIGEHEPVLRLLHERYGGVGDAYALALLANGRVPEARAVRVPGAPLRQDYYHAVFATLRAMAVVALSAHGPVEREEVRMLTEVLLPLRDQVPGAPSTSLALRPVAHTLGELALLLGRPEEAAGHFSRAVEVARRWGAPLWERDAQAAMSRLG